jgi:hypothetical protein
MPSAMKRLLRAAVVEACLRAGLAGPQTLLPPGEASAIIQQKCLLCHGEEPLLRHKRDREAWRKIVETMDANGARVTADEIKTRVRSG